MSTSPDADFTGNLPAFYEQFLVPLIFEDAAADLAARVTRLRPDRILEVACGTGVVTRAMVAGLPAVASLTATDLSQPMVDHAAELAPDLGVHWQQADVMTLPFDDSSFDLVVCQFGVMFFPDKPAAFAEIRRVLEPEGTFVFTTWDRIETNEFAHVVDAAVAILFPDDPPQFMARTPHGYFDHEQIRADLLAAGFPNEITIDVREARSRSETCMIPAIAFCQGTPLRNEIDRRDPGMLAHATEVASAALAAAFGETDLDGLIRGFVVTAPATSGAHRPH